MRILFASIALALTLSSAVSSAETAAQPTGRWCVINAADNARHCYFQHHSECMRAISDGNGICVPSERRRGDMLDDNSK
jgi:hypothetical protein